MTRFEREIERQRRRLTDTDERATGGIAGRFGRVRRTLASRTRALLDVVTRRRRKRQRTDSAWLHASEEFSALIADTTERIVPFLAEALRLTEEGQGRMLDEVAPDVRRLAELALGPAPGDRPPPLPRWLALELGSLRPDVASRILGSATDGRPLALLFAELAPGALAAHHRHPRVWCDVRPRCRLDRAGHRERVGDDALPRVDDRAHGDRPGASRSGACGDGDTREPDRRMGLACAC